MQEYQKNGDTMEMMKLLPGVKMESASWAPLKQV